MLQRILPLFFVILVAFIPAAAQTGSGSSNRDMRGTPPAEKKSGVKDLDEDGQENLNLPDEMRVRMLIERREQDYKKIMDSVDKLSILSGEVADSFQHNGKLSSDDLKKLEAIEKLAHQVLSHSGGEAVEDKEHTPAQVGEAIQKIGEAACNIKKSMTAENRFVVSASVIASSNDVINLSRF